MNRIVKMKFGPYEANLNSATGLFVVTHAGLSVGSFSILTENIETRFLAYVDECEYLFKRKHNKGTIPTKRVPIPLSPVYSSDPYVTMNIATMEVYDCEIQVTME